MQTWAIIATGQSLRQEDVDYLRGKCKVVAVSDAYNLAPWADVLVSYDRAWWEANPSAVSFAGLKYAKTDQVRGVTNFRTDEMPMGCNSGLMAMFVARMLGAERIILLGFDMYGTHYFGPHEKGLKNTSSIRFEQMKKQFTRFSGCEVINSTRVSALDCYLKKPLREVL